MHPFVCVSCVGGIPLTCDITACHSTRIHATCRYWQAGRWHFNLQFLSIGKRTGQRGLSAQEFIVWRTFLVSPQFCAGNQNRIPGSDAFPPWLPVTSDLCLHSCQSDVMIRGQADLQGVFQVARDRQAPVVDLRYKPARYTTNTLFRHHSPCIPNAWLYDPIILGPENDTAIKGHACAHHLTARGARRRPAPHPSPGPWR